MKLNNVQEPLVVHGATMKESSFENVSLANTRFDDVNLRDSTFTNVCLAGVVCVDVNLTNASISNANLTGMTVNGILLNDMIRAYRSRETAGNGTAVGVKPVAGAVVYAKDRPNLQRFYENVLGLELESTGNDHVVLRSRGFQLVIVEIPAHVAARITVETPPRLRSESATKLTFPVASIATVRTSAGELGGRVLPPDREWSFKGRRVCDGNDPEGNVFQLWESGS